MPLQITTPVGRFVQGDAFVGQDKDQQGKPYLIQSGPNAGQPYKKWFMGVAFAKTSPDWPPFWAQLVAQAAADWPTLFPHGPQPQNAPDHPQPGGCVLPSFAFKVVNGDGFDTTGKSNATKEGFAGHWVVKFGSGFAPKCYPAGRYAPADQITDPNLLRRGYYVRVATSVEGNKQQTKPGLYVNLSLVELAGHGPEIISGPDASAAFGGTPVTLPPGASAVPVASGPLPGGGASPPAAPYTPPTTVGAPTAPPPAPSAPYDGYRAANAGAAAPPAPAAPPVPMQSPSSAPPPPPAKVLLDGGDYAAHIAAGWTDALLIQHGKMAPQ